MIRPKSASSASGGGEGDAGGSRRDAGEAFSWTFPTDEDPTEGDGVRN